MHLLGVRDSEKHSLRYLVDEKRSETPTVSGFKRDILEWTLIVGIRDEMEIKRKHESQQRWSSGENKKG